MEAARKQTTGAPQDGEQPPENGDSLQARGQLVLDEALRRRIAEAVQPIAAQIQREAKLAAEQQLLQELPATGVEAPPASPTASDGSAPEDSGEPDSSPAHASSDAEQSAPEEPPAGAAQEGEPTAEATEQPYDGPPTQPAEASAPEAGAQDADSPSHGALLQGAGAPEPVEPEDGIARQDVVELAEAPPENSRDADDSSNDEEEKEEGGLFSGLGRAVGDALQVAVRQEAADPLHTLYHTGLDRLFSRSFGEILQPQIEETIWTLLDPLLETVDNDALRHALREEAVGLVHGLTARTFRAVFTDAVCHQLERHGDRAIDSMLAGNAAGALREVTRASRFVLPRVLGALEGEWGMLLPFLARVAFAALRETVESAIKEGLGFLPSVDAQEIQEKAESTQERVEDAADELREKLAEVAEELRRRIQEEKGGLRERVSEGVRSALHGGSGNPGGRPSGKPPHGGPLGGRPPSSRIPSGRPPAGPLLLPPTARKAR